MKKKYKAGLYIVVVFALIAIGALIYLKKIKPESTQAECNSTDATVCPVDLSGITEATATTTQVGSYGTPQPVNENIFKSDKLGFQLNFSDVWKTAKVSELPSTGSAIGAVEFKLPTKDSQFKDGLATALTVYVYPIESVPPASEKPLLTKITDNGKWYYGYEGWLQAPTDLGQITEKEIAREASTLKLLN